MLKPILLSAAIVLFSSITLAQDAPAKIPPAADGAENALKNSPRHGEWVDIPIPNSDAKLHAFIVYPERKEKAPVVLVIHEIFGMTDWVRAVADQLAAEGFIAVAPDFLSGKGPGGGNSDSFKGDEARGAVSKLDKDEVAQRLDAARDYAAKLPSASGKSASIGFCWGGAQSFYYATRQAQLNAAVVYYGTPPDKDALTKINAPVLGLYGGNDSRVTSTVEPTIKTMSELKKLYTPHVFEGAGHGFLRQQNAPGTPNHKAAEQAWSETITFLKKNLE